MKRKKPWRLAVPNWFVVYDKEKKDYFAIEDKHEGTIPKMIGKAEVVGYVSFKKPVDAIDYIKFIGR